MKEKLREVLRLTELAVTAGDIKAVVVLMQTRRGTWSMDFAGVKVAQDEEWIGKFSEVHPHEDTVEDVANGPQ